LKKILLNKIIIFSLEYNNKNRNNCQVNIYNIKENLDIIDQFWNEAKK